MIQEERVKELLPQEQEKKLRQNNPDTPDYQIDLATNRALGMIETEGFVAAIVAADAGLKAASVNLYSLGKVGSGIVTIFLTGDVGAIQSAVDAGSEAAAAIGILRAKHIIPRIHTDVAIKTIHPIKPVRIPTGENGDTEVVTLAKSRADMPSAVVRADSIKNEKAGETMEKELNEIETLGNGDFYLEKFQDEPLDQNSYNKNNFDEADHPDPKEAARQEVFRKVNLKNNAALLEMSNQDLRDMILKLDDGISNSKLKSMRKEELITYLQDAEKSARGIKN